MSVPLEQVFTADCMEVRFPNYYDQKAFMADVSRLRDLVRKGGRERLSDDELAEVPLLRRRIRRIDGDTAMLLVLQNRQRGGWNFF